MTAKTFGQRPSSLLGLTGPLVALDVDQTLAVRLAAQKLRAQRIAAGGTYSSLDEVLAGRAPRFTPDGLRYEDPAALYRFEMEQRRQAGLIH